MNWSKVWNWFEHNRFSVIVPVVALTLWLVAVGCTPQTVSPLSGRLVTAAELQVDFDTTMARFELSAIDLEKQAEAQSEFRELLLALASGTIADWSGLLQMLVTGGLVGFFADNVRKNGVIGGLKKKG